MIHGGRLGIHLHEFVEGFYNYWRGFDRFMILHSEPGPTSLDQRPYRAFNATLENLDHVVRALYRDICENITGDHPRVYRQMAAGCDMGLIAIPKRNVVPSRYSKLFGDIPFIRQVMINPPLIIDLPTNKRTGHYQVAILLAVVLPDTVGMLILVQMALLSKRQSQHIRIATI